MSKEITLGEKLYKKIEEEKNDKLLALKRKVEEEDEKEKNNLNKVINGFEMIKEVLIQSISNDKTIPTIIIGGGYSKNFYKNKIIIKDLVEIFSYDIKTITNQYNKYNPIYENFENWLKENNLKCSIKDEHDGAGMESWYTLSVEPNLNLKNNIKRKM